MLAAFQAVPREYYHYEYPEHRATPGDAYEDNPKPWALGWGSALSDYLGQAYMTQICKPAPGEVTLEIGTGSGFQSSLLSRIVAKSYSIEIIEPLGKAVGKIFAPLGYDNVHTRVGDGYYGWPEVQGGFDIIIVTCAATFAPPDLFKQLKPGGRMIIPIGQPFKRGQVLYVYTKDAEGKIHSKRDIGVFFIPMTGAIQQKPAGAAGDGVGSCAGARRSPRRRRRSRRRSRQGRCLNSGLDRGPPSHGLELAETDCRFIVMAGEGPIGVKLTRDRLPSHIVMAGVCLTGVTIEGSRSGRCLIVMVREGAPTTPCGAGWG